MYLNLYTYDMIYQTIPNNYDFTANKGVNEDLWNVTLVLFSNGYII
jgi:hypothetical protein